jgi:hypothetical protein
VVTVAGNSTPSEAATLTVSGTAAPATLLPFVGINFVGGGGGIPGGELTASDVAGVVPQENYNNIAGAPLESVALVSAAGTASAVTAYLAPGPIEGSPAPGTSTTGTGDDNADRALLQGYVQANNNPFVLVLSNVPPANYALIFYTIGFNFQTTYSQAIEVVGSNTYPAVRYTAQHAGEYAGTYVRASGSDTNSRALGNYVQIEGLRPAADGTLIVTLTPESDRTGVTVIPALNAVQLLRVSDAPPVTGVAGLGASAAGDNVTLSWSAGTPPFLVQGRPSLASGSWLNLATTTERTFTLPVTTADMYFRVVAGATNSIQFFRATLTGEAERPDPVTTPGRGGGFVALEGASITYVVGYWNLKTNATAAHIHGPAPASGTAGVLLNLTPAGAFGSSGVLFGQAALGNDLRSAITNGQSYFNIHTPAPNGHPGGEIRGQLVP